ncbi:PHP domain-containing protein [Marinicrinis lubricantis]|uniref:PHP domain-containing protein n=1 Tax=Marinicrinis lubricantis TaxID=2086470 RepID=A0ABW1IMQ6_9BACL
MELNGWADLHSHSTASDGTEAPKDNVRMAQEAGLTAVAITDHDTVAGVREALAEGRERGIEVVPGVEISTVMGGIDIHVLGYFIDTENDLLLERLDSLRKARYRRNLKIIENLNRLGINIRLEDVTERAAKNGKDETVGRPHIADVLVDRGIVDSMQEAFEVYLDRKGKAYAQVERIRPETAVQWIREAGGAAVLAHPGIYHNDEIVQEIIVSGIDGIEAYHSDHSVQDEERYLRLAHEHKLIVTAGSDFHGTRQGNVFHGALGSKRIDMKAVHALKGLSQQMKEQT